MDRSVCGVVRGNGQGVELAIERSLVRIATDLHSRNAFGQVVHTHTHVPRSVSPSSTT